MVDDDRFPSPFDPDAVAINWFHYDCMFDQFTRARKGTQVTTGLHHASSVPRSQIIESGDDMDGWDDLPADAKVLPLMAGLLDLGGDGGQVIIEKCIKNEHHQAPAPKESPSKKRAAAKHSKQGSKVSLG